MRSAPQAIHWTPPTQAKKRFQTAAAKYGRHSGYKVTTARPGGSSASAGPCGRSAALLGTALIQEG